MLSPKSNSSQNCAKPEEGTHEVGPETAVVPLECPGSGADLSVTALDFVGVPGSGGPKGPRNGNYKHGRYTAEAIASRRGLRQCIRDARALTKTPSSLTLPAPFNAR
jgi:hypothetical protein